MYQSERLRFRAKFLNIETKRLDLVKKFIFQSEERFIKP
jgi:hypothetical protein